MELNSEVQKDIEPCVINNALLLRCVDEQKPSGEAGKLFYEETEMEELVQLRLEFLNILRIDHLWMLTNLTKLSLSNNIIEVVENLDQLVNLKELDLSFNYIKKIENVSKLVNLETLTFYSNQISVIENMNTLKNLHLFSIGRNNITDKKNIFYLRRFKKLRSLNMAENPCAREEFFRNFVGIFLPQLTYYEYRRIYVEERNKGLDLYKNVLKEVENSEIHERQLEEKEESERAEAELHKESFIEFLGGRQLFDSLFEKDPDAQMFLSMSEELVEFYKEYETNFLQITRQLFEMGMEQYHIRKKEMAQYYACVGAAKAENQSQSQVVMEEFLDQKKEIFDKIKQRQLEFEFNDFDVQDYTEQIQFLIDDYNDMMRSAWKQMMGLEMNLFEQLEEANLQFERALTELVNQFIEGAQALFTQCRTLEQIYCEQVQDITSKLVQLHEVQDVSLNEEHKMILEDKELLNNAIATSHDIHMQLIDGREDRLVSKAREWLTNLCENISRNEIKRNRSKILEINHFLDIQGEDLQEVQSLLMGEFLDED